MLSKPATTAECAFVDQSKIIKALEKVTCDQAIFFFLRSGEKKNRLIAGYEEGQIDNMHV